MRSYSFAGCFVLLYSLSVQYFPTPSCVLHVQPDLITVIRIIKDKNLCVFLESNQEIPLSGVIQAFDHNNMYRKNRYTDDDN
jgi:hypothetical protein